MSKSSVRYGNRFFPASESYGLTPAQNQWLQIWSLYGDQQKGLDPEPIRGVVVGLLPTSTGPQEIEPEHLLYAHQFELVCLSAFPTELLRGFRGTARWSFPVAVQSIGPDGSAGRPSAWRDLDCPPKRPEPKVDALWADKDQILDLKAPMMDLQVSEAGLGPFIEVYGGKSLLYRFEKDSVRLQLLAVSTREMLVGQVVFTRAAEYGKAKFEHSRAEMFHPSEPVINADRVALLLLLNEMWADLAADGRMGGNPPAMRPHEGLEAFRYYTEEEYRSLLSAIPTPGQHSPWRDHIFEGLRKEFLSGADAFQVYCPPEMVIYEGDVLDASGSDPSYIHVSVSNPTIQTPVESRQFVVPVGTQLRKKLGANGVAGHLSDTQTVKLLDDPDYGEILLRSYICSCAARGGETIYLPGRLFPDYDPNRTVFRVGSAMIPVEGGGCYLPSRTGDIDIGFVPMLQTMPRQDRLKSIPQEAVKTPKMPTPQPEAVVV